MTAKQLERISAFMKAADVDEQVQVRSCIVSVWDESDEWTDVMIEGDESRLLRMVSFVPRDYNPRDYKEVADATA